jgi:tyrosyl-tRNA synthetase
MVGDPSGKSAERNLLDLETLQHNLDCQKKQLEKFLDFDCGANSAEIVNNYDWFKEFDFLGFIRDVGKHMSVNYMMAKDSVKKRLDTGMSFTEFSYQLIQGYDFYHLWKNNGVKLQMGGSDQWGNITTGTELIRRLGRGSAHALTTPLIKKADGTKFGKSEGGNVWLDPARTSPYAFYQFWLNASDADAENYIKIFSIKSREEIEALIAEHAEAPFKRALQKALAEEITVRVHSQADLDNALAASQILFGKATEDQLRSLDRATLESVFEGVPQFELAASALEGGLDIVEALAEHTAVFPSKGEARKMVQGNGVAINKTKVGVDKVLTKDDVVADGLIIVQKGKKNYFLVKVS